MVEKFIPNLIHSANVIWILLILFVFLLFYKDSNYDCVTSVNVSLNIDVNKYYYTPRTQRFKSTIVWKWFKCQILMDVSKQR